MYQTHFQQTESGEAGLNLLFKGMSATAETHRCSSNQEICILQSNQPREADLEIGNRIAINIA
jgi:hypothetical protein